MKRFHIHVTVTNLDDSVRFYSRLFGEQPVKQESDYAKWMLDSPRLNFAISSRGFSTGVNHLGFEAEAPEELEALKQLAEEASASQLLDPGEATCCYARSDKHWVMDPQGLAWEHFLTMSDAAVYGNDAVTRTSEACCIPMRGSEQDAATTGDACCLSASKRSAADGCCNQSGGMA